MNNTKEILDICQSTSPPSQLLSIFDSDIQKSVVDFFVSDLTAFGRETSTYIVLALQKNAKGEWIWISTNSKFISNCFVSYLTLIPKGIEQCSYFGVVSPVYT